MQNEKGIIASGAGLLWRRQRVLWWLFAANLIAGLLASAPVNTQLRILDSSRIASDSLYHEMNPYRVIEALLRPEGISSAFLNGSTLLVGAYFVFLLFAVGGVLESFYTDRTPTFGDFLRASAGFFWRMLRLLIVFGIIVTPLAIAHGSIGDLTDWLGKRSDSERLGFWISLAITIILTLIALAIRVWIDIAQVDSVAQEQRAVRRSLRAAWRLLRGRFLRVYGAVIAIQLFLAVITLALLLVWVKVPHEGVGRTFLIGELIVLLWLGSRLWQKAAETAWYLRRSEQDAQPLSVEETVPATIFASPSGPRDHLRPL